MGRSGAPGSGWVAESWGQKVICEFCADDHARIKLKVESSPSRSDYINASPIVSSSDSHTDSAHQHCSSLFHPP
jgi:hypothetical protein